MQDRNLLDLVKTLPKDVRHLLFSWLETQSVGRLSSVSKDFKLFCDERMVWSERLRRVFNINAAHSDDPKKIYQRLKREFAELGAFLKQFCIYKLLVADAELLLNASKEFNDSFRNKSWRPLNDDELLKLTIKFGGSNEDFEFLSALIDHFTSEQTLFTNPKIKKLEDQKQTTVFELLADSMTFAFATKEGSIKNFVNTNDISLELKIASTGLCLIGLVFILTPAFFSHRGYTDALKVFLDRIDKNNFPDIKSRAKVPHEITVDYGDEIFKQALGHLCMLTAGVTLQDSSAPSSELVEYLIKRNAGCVKARDAASGFMAVFNRDGNGYTAIYYNPLSMVIESINSVNTNICKSEEAAFTYLRELEKIALLLIENGEDINRVFMPNVNPNEGITPAKMIQTNFESMQRIKIEAITALDMERKRILENLLTYQPAPKPNPGEYVDTFPYFKP